MQKFDASLDTLIRDLKGINPLSNDDNISLIKAYRESNDKKILDKIIVGNIWFIISRAKRYRNRYLSASDLINAGVMGIIRAIKKFDFKTKDFLF